MTNVISNRLERIKSGNDPEMLAALPSGYAILGKYQPDAINGCCMLIPDPVVSSPNDLDHRAREQFFADLVLIGDAILRVTRAERINYLVLCNQVPELHGHCVPRFADEDPARRLQGPFEAYDFASARVADANAQDATLHRSLKDAIEQLVRERDG